MRSVCNRESASSKRLLCFQGEAVAVIFQARHIDEPFQGHRSYVEPELRVVGGSSACVRCLQLAYSLGAGHSCIGETAGQNASLFRLLSDVFVIRAL